MFLFVHTQGSDHEASVGDVLMAVLSQNETVVGKDVHQEILMHFIDFRNI